MPPSKISPSLQISENDQYLTIAAGCFWGVESIYRKHYLNKGIIDLKVGYANGNANKFDNPDYKTVCTGETNYAEVLQISFDPKKVSYNELIEFFFRIHDPTTLNSQGRNKGTQYRSAIFVNNDEQLLQAQEELEKAQKDWYPNHKIVTKIEHLENFYDAEEYHQKYLIKNPDGYACPNHVLRLVPKE